MLTDGGGVVSSTVISNGGKIDALLHPYYTGATASVNTSTDVLTVSEGGRSFTYQLAGSYTGASFAVSDDGGGGTAIVRTVAHLPATALSPAEDLAAARALLAGLHHDLPQPGRTDARAAPAAAHSAGPAGAAELLAPVVHHVVAWHLG